MKHHHPACRRRRGIEHFGVGYTPLDLPGLMQDRPGTMALQRSSSSALQTMHALAYDGPAFHLRILIKRRLRCICGPALALALPNLLHQDRRFTFRPHPWTSLLTTTSASRTLSPRLAQSKFHDAILTRGTTLDSSRCTFFNAQTSPPRSSHAVDASPARGHPQMLPIRSRLRPRLYHSCVASRRFARTSYQTS